MEILRVFHQTMQDMAKQALVALLLTAVGILLASMAVYCLEHMLGMLDQIIVGGGLTIASLCCLASSIITLRSPRRCHRTIN